MNKIILCITFLLMILCIGAPTKSFAEDFSMSLEGDIKEGSLSTHIKKLNSLTKDDTLTLYIRSPGGSVYEMTKMTVAMVNSPAKTIISVVDEYAASAAAFITAFSDRIILQNDAEMLFHLGSSYNEETQERIVFSSSTRIDSLPEDLQKYLPHIINLTKNTMFGLGFHKQDVFLSLSNPDGFIFKGSIFKIYNPMGVGLRKNDTVRKYLLELKKYYEL